MQSLLPVYFISCHSEGSKPFDPAIGNQSNLQPKGILSPNSHKHTKEKILNQNGQGTESTINQSFVFALFLFGWFAICCEFEAF